MVIDEFVLMLVVVYWFCCFDWMMFFVIFLMEEVKHVEFFMRWYEWVVGVFDFEEVV